MPSEAQLTLHHTTRVDEMRGERQGREIRTVEFTPDLENDVAIGIFGVVRGVECDQLLADGEQLVAGHVAEVLSVRERERVAFDMEDGLAVGHLDVEAVTRQRHGFLLQRQCLVLSCHEVLENPQSGRVGRKLSHGCCCCCCWTWP